MTLKTRIIPILLTDGKGNVVKPIKFQRPYRIVGNLMQHIRVLEKRNVDELILIDIEASNEGRLIDCDKIKEYTKELYCPVTLGGGIENINDINKLLKSGADKISIQNKSNSFAFVKLAARTFGSQCITISVDVKQGREQEAEEFCSYMYMCGAGEILLTSMDEEGTMEGYDIELLIRVADRLNIPVIINGGAGDPSHMEQAIKNGASAVAASSMFLFKDFTPRDCAKYLQERGLQGVYCKSNC